MNHFWIIGIALALALLAFGIVLFPKGHANVGLVSGQLSPCPNTPNCVCSENTPKPSYIPPLVFSGDDSMDSSWQRVRQVIVSSGGRIEKEEQGYLWASFTTKWLRFVDDVELRIDAGSQVIHLRSASRLGRSDFGVNRERVERLRLLLNRRE